MTPTLLESLLSWFTRKNLGHGGCPSITKDSSTFKNRLHCQLSSVDFPFVCRPCHQPVFTIYHSTDKGVVTDSHPNVCLLITPDDWVLERFVPLFFLCLAWPGFNKAVVSSALPSGAPLQSKHIHLAVAFSLVKPFWHSLVLFNPFHSVHPHHCKTPLLNHSHHKQGSWDAAAGVLSFIFTIVRFTGQSN